MESLETSRIPLGVRLQFSRASVEVIARGGGIRLLHIKGETVEPSIQGRRRTGTDVDVLVDPTEIRAMHRLLVAHGWRVYSTFLDGSPFGHAQTYHHADWGFLDLHRRFPGIRIADRSAFALLWDDHTHHDAVGVQCAIPALDGQVVLHMLNAARGTSQGRSEARELWQSLPADDANRRRMLVTQLRADVAFDVTMGELERHRRSREYRLWRAIVDGGDRGAEWWARLIAARTPIDAAQTALRAPLVNRSRLAHELGRDPRPVDLVVASVKRLGAGIRELLPRRRS